MKTSVQRILLALAVSTMVLAGPATSADPPARRPQFVYVLKVAPKYHVAADWTDKERAAVTRHFERLVKAAESNQVILAGRTSEPLPETFGLVVFEADDAKAARQFMEEDPAVVAGVMIATLHPYAIALQRKPKSE